MEIKIPEIKGEIVELEYGWQGQFTVEGNVDDDGNQITVKLCVHRKRDKAKDELTKEIKSVIDSIVKDK